MSKKPPEGTPGRVLNAAAAPRFSALHGQARTGQDGSRPVARGEPGSAPALGALFANSTAAFT